jgi:hypothetical protein
MIAWILGIITLILLLFVIWRRASKSFRDRCERPKFLFLESLGVRSPKDQRSTQTQFPQEEKHGFHHS